MSDFFMLSVVITCILCLVSFAYAQEMPILPEISSGSNNITVYLEQSFDQIHFVPRTRMQLIFKADGKQGTLYLEKNVIAGDNLLQLKQLIVNKGLYTLRIRTEKPDWTGNFVLTSLPVCALQRSAFKEDIQLFLDANGNINGLAYSVPPMTVAHDCDAGKIKDAIQLQTRLRLGDEMKAQSIPLQLSSSPPPYLQHVRLSPEDGRESGPQGTERQSFLQRYWYVVLGLMLYMILGNGGAPAPQGAATEGNRGAAPTVPARK